MNFIHDGKVVHLSKVLKLHFQYDLCMIHEKKGLDNMYGYGRPSKI